MTAVSETQSAGQQCLRAGPRNHRRPQPRLRRRLHVLRPRHEQSPHPGPALHPYALRHRDAESEGARRRLRRQRDFVPRLSLRSGQIRADGLRRQRRRGLRPHDRLAAPVHRQRNQDQAHRRARHARLPLIWRCNCSLPESKPKSFPSTRSSRKCSKASTKPG